LKKSISFFSDILDAVKKEYAVLSHYGGCRNGRGWGIAEVPRIVM